MALILIGVTILHQVGALDWIWDTVVNSGVIANANTVFNLAASILLFPTISLMERTSVRLIPDDKEPENKYKDKLDALNPMFFDTPALALGSLYDILLAQLRTAKSNIEDAFGLLENYDAAVYEKIMEEEDSIDILTDRISRYIVEFLPHVRDEQHVAILNQYYKVVTEFERLGDHAVNIADNANILHSKQRKFSPTALAELKILEDLLEEILEAVEKTFEKRDVEAAFKIEPLREVASEMVSKLKRHHLDRMGKGECDIYADSNFENLMSDMKRIADVSTNIGEATLVRVNPELAENEHVYFTSLRSGKDQKFNKEFNEAHEKYTERFRMIENQ